MHRAGIGGGFERGRPFAARDIEAKRLVKAREPEQEPRHTKHERIDHEHHVSLREREVVVEGRERQSDDL